MIEIKAGASASGVSSAVAGFRYFSAIRLEGAEHHLLAATNHEVAHYINHLHVNIAGVGVALGIGMGALAWYGIRRGQRWAWATAIALPVVFLAHSLPIHRTAGFSFDALLHLGPGVIWLPDCSSGLCWHTEDYKLLIAPRKRMRPVLDERWKGFPNINPPNRTGASALLGHPV